MKNQLLTAETEYASAFRVHYTDDNVLEALGLYASILTNYPGSRESGHARVQIRNIRLGLATTTPDAGAAASPCSTTHSGEVPAWFRELLHEPRMRHPDAAAVVPPTPDPRAPGRTGFMQRDRRRYQRLASLVAVASITFLSACKPVDETVDDINDSSKSEVTGQVTDYKGKPIEGVTVDLFHLIANTGFVEGGNIEAGEAYIDRKAILASDNAARTTKTGADGKFKIDGVFPDAFLAVARKKGCTSDFAGFDENTGVLSLDTLITPDGGLDFAVPTFILACETPPANVGPDGNTDEAAPFEPPTDPAMCDADICTAAGGSCVESDCVFTCQEASCNACGGTCESGACVLPSCDATACGAAGGTCNGDVCEVPACDEPTCTAAGGTCNAGGTACDIPACTAVEAACEAAGGRCSTDGTLCELPACETDADCQAGQPGALCSDAGDIDLAACHAPPPGEIVPPVEATGWTGFKITDSADKVLADAGTENGAIAASAIPASGLARVYGSYTGSADKAFVHVQTGGTNCLGLPPRTDYFTVGIVDGKIANGYLEIYLHGGYQKIALSTSATLGQGDKSFVIEVGEPCKFPTHPFVATMSWDAGPGQPADLDLNVWNAAGDLVYIGRKDAAWGQLAREGRSGPGPEIFYGDDASAGPFTIKVLFFSGKPRAIEGKVRIVRILDNILHDDSFTFTVDRPKDVAEIGVFASQ